MLRMGSPLYICVHGTVLPIGYLGMFCLVAITLCPTLIANTSVTQVFSDSTACILLFVGLLLD